MRSQELDQIVEDSRPSLSPCASTTFTLECPQMVLEEPAKRHMLLWFKGRVHLCAGHQVRGVALRCRVRAFVSLNATFQRLELGAGNNLCNLPPFR